MRAKLICIMHPNQPLSPTTPQWLGKPTQYTLANSNLHQPLISCLYIIPSCKQYWKDVQKVMQSMKSNWRGIWLLKPSIIINIWFNYIKRLFFYYLRYLHDIRMQFCGFGCGCQNPCGYSRIPELLTFRNLHPNLTIVLIEVINYCQLFDEIYGSRSFWSRSFGSGTLRSRSFWSWSFWSGSFWSVDSKDII